MEEKKQGEIVINVKADTTEVEEAKEKIKELVNLLKEAKELADSIASTELDIHISAEHDRDSTIWARITGWRKEQE